MKAKSWDPSQDSLTGQSARANPIAPDWEPYVYDVAFQERVFSLAYPGLRVQPWLMLVDKSRRNSVAGLGVQFPVLGEDAESARRTGGRVRCRSPARAASGAVDASEAVRIAQTQVRKKKGRPDVVFDSLIDSASAAVARGDRLGPFAGTPCKKCEFYCPPARAKRRAAQRLGGMHGDASEDRGRTSARAVGVWILRCGEGR